jgi:hypothetical protein
MKTKHIIFTAIVIVSLFVIKSCSSPTCVNSKSEYQDGYNMGKRVRSMGESFSCNSFVKLYNEQGGRTPVKATDCFCEGYKDGLHGQSTKYQLANN